MGRNRARSICIDCGNFHYGQNRCMECYRMHLERTRPVYLCACGRPRNAVSATGMCLKCYTASLASEEMLHLRIPETCDCGKGSTPTPNHCQCTRWKLSTSERCEVCAS